MRLLHYSDTPISAVYSVEQADLFWSGGRKPSGLWVSVEGEHDWRSWCRAESFRDCDSQIAHEVVLVDGHNVLMIDTPARLMGFHAKFHTADRNIPGREVIDWRRVAEKHRGVIIAPYRWDARLAEPYSSWYYGWDCASGCIWDASAIAEMRQVARIAEAVGSVA